MFIVNINVSMLRQMPKIEIRSNARPSMFAYVPPLEEKKDKKGEKVETAVLSITAKAKKKEAEKKKGEKKEEKMDVVRAADFQLSAARVYCVVAVSG